MKQKPEEKYYKRRLISSYFSVVLSITLVLFLIGILGLLLVRDSKTGLILNGATVSIQDSEGNIFGTKISNSEGVVEYIIECDVDTKLVGSKIDYESGSTTVAGTSEEEVSAELLLTPIEEINTYLANYSYINEVNYDQPLLELLDENIKKITYWMLFASLIFVLVAVLLINSSIRLSIYS